MPVMYEVNGYDRKTDELKFSVDVPERRVPSVLRTANVPQSDDRLGSYHLQGGQLFEIASLLGIQIDQDDLEFYLEPYESPRKAAGLPSSHPAVALLPASGSLALLFGSPEQAGSSPVKVQLGPRTPFENPCDPPALSLSLVKFPGGPPCRNRREPALPPIR